MSGMMMTWIVLMDCNGTLIQIVILTESQSQKKKKKKKKKNPVSENVCIVAI
jgi:hypothetical protein